MTPQMPDEPTPTAAPAAAANARLHISNARRYFLFAIFCIANLLDAYNLNALFAGLPALKNAFGLSEVDASWVMSGFELTYASFLLIVSGLLLDSLSFPRNGRVLLCFVFVPADEFAAM